MFDPNLQKEKAHADIADPNAVVLKTSMEKRIIDLCRKTSDARNHCFANESNYRENFARFKELPAKLVRELATLEPFRFIHNNFSVYANAGALQRQYADAVYFLSTEFLVEILSNSMAESDNVETTLHIAPKGVLIDVDQGLSGFGSDFLEDVRRKSSKVYELMI